MITSFTREIDKNPVIAATQKPTARTEKSSETPDDTASLNSSTLPPRIAGMPRMKEYVTAVSLVSQQNKPADVVLPERETPGNNATH